MMWNGHGGHGAGWEGPLMFLFMIVFAAAAVVAVIYFVRYLAQPPAAPAQIASAPAAQYAAPGAVTAAVESPQEILKRRYAAGEIEREEYLQKLGDL